ncbi:MAG: hypothetical protein JKX88_10690 [Marinicaulis sp.]|nr:hypothetical protein [Marinicaulis sp.]
MVYKKRIIAPIAFAWTLAAAGMAAVALTVAPATTPSILLPSILLDDVQVGERGNQTRIALICDSPCVVEKHGTRAFLLRGVNASLELDLSLRTKNVSMLSATPTQEGALLSISTVGVIEYANTKNCTIGGRPAACIDLFFASVTKPEPSDEVAARIVKAPKLKNGEVKQSSIGNKSAIAAPVLREGAPDRMIRFARLTPPERLTPAPGAILAKVQPVATAMEISKPTIRSETPLIPPKFNFNRRIARILKKQLTPIHCATADLTLQADAWALDAMVDAGLCAAVRGDVEEADAMLARLLEYTPDNYEALVGRALIAAQANEKGVARKYFQDALNALPPIAESNRIVQAMSAL